MPLKAVMQRRPRKMRDCGLQRVEIVVQRKQSVPTESDNDSFFLFAENRRTQFLRPSLSIFNGRSFLPLRDRFGINPKLPAQLRGRSLPLSSKLRFDRRAVNRCIAALAAYVVVAQP